MLEVVYALWRRDMIKFLRDRRQLVTSLTRSLIWLLAFAGNRIEWRGERMRLMRDGTLARVD